jgi:hypothetical protein
VKKPDGKAEAGWYDAPEIEGYLQYWNGKYWTKHKQVKDGFEDIKSVPKKSLGRFLFRNPIMEDGAFIAYLVISGIVFVYLVIDYFELTSGLAAVVLIINGTLITSALIYVIFLLFLIPRRIFDRRKGLTKYSNVDSKGTNIKTEDTVDKPEFQSRKRYLAVIGTILVLALIALLSASSENDFEREADDFFNQQKEISVILNEWNKESSLLLGIIQKNSSGEIDYPEAMYALNDVTGRISPVLASLREECTDVPVKSLNQTGEAQAAALAWNMLKVTCDLVPLQFTEYLSIFDAQVSEDKTQADIDFHVQRLTDFGNQRKQAAIQAINELEKYASGSQLEQIKSLKNLLS